MSAAGERAQRGWLHFYPRQESTKFTFTIDRGLWCTPGGWGRDPHINCDVFNPRTCLGCQTGVETAIAASGPFLGLCSPEFLWLKALAGGPLHKDPPYPRPTFTIVQSFTGSCANFYHFTFDSYRRATTHRIHTPPAPRSSDFPLPPLIIPPNFPSHPVPDTASLVQRHGLATQLRIALSSTTTP